MTAKLPRSSAKVYVDQICKYKVFKMKESVTIYAPEPNKLNDVQVKTSKIAYDFLMKNEYYTKYNIYSFEIFYVIGLSRAAKIVYVEELGIGSSFATVFNMTRMISSLCLNNCLRFIVVHNHPGSTLEASQGDKAVAQQFVELSRLTDFKILDCLIITANGYLSFADEGILY